ncbi:MAG: DUF5320 domain-containing protein [Eubacteriaceae bacterium]
MPAGDGTGPMGLGRMIGRGLGFCAGYVVPGYLNNSMRRGMGLGRGFGRGRAPYGYTTSGVANMSAVDEKELLSNQVKTIEYQLQQLKNRLNILNEDAE